jgi:YidC/Oxa1 family membrane protein insertase
MKAHVFLSFLVVGANGFAPTPLATFGRTSNTRVSLIFDPFTSIDLHSTQDQFASIANVLPAFTISDAIEAVEDFVTDVFTDSATEAAKESDAGWFGFLTGPIKLLLVGIHGLIASFGGSNSWGISIVFLTILIKVLTFPLNKSQLESTNKMQAMQPAVKDIQAKYQSNPEVMNQKIAEFYQVNEINPLAGCIPSLIQIPVFIGLYRAVLDLADENKLTEPFLFLPSLEGPTFGADPASGSDWILKGW